MRISLYSFEFPRLVLFSFVLKSISLEIPVIAFVNSIIHIYTWVHFPTNLFTHLLTYLSTRIFFHALLYLMNSISNFRNFVIKYRLFQKNWYHFLIQKTWPILVHVISNCDMCWNKSNINVWFFLFYSSNVIYSNKKKRCLNIKHRISNSFDTEIIQVNIFSIVFIRLQRDKLDELQDVKEDVVDSWEMYRW